MNNRVIEIVNKYEQLHKFFIRHEQLLKSKRGFLLRYNRFCLKKSVLAVTVAHWEIITDISENIYDKLRNTLCELAESIMAILVQTGKTEYMAKAGFATGMFEQMGDEQLTGYCRDVYSLLLQNPETFIRQGIVLEVRNTFSGAIELFATKTTNKVIQSNLVKHFEQLIEKLDAELESLLKSDMDLFIARLRLMRPLVVSEYKALRRKIKSIN